MTCANHDLFCFDFMRQAYAREVDEHKRTLLLVNKADLLPASVRFKLFVYGLLLYSVKSTLLVFHPANILIICLLLCPFFLAERNG